MPALDITAIVTVTDDGGSSGRLRREFDVLPPGDIRNCMVALSEDSALLSRLFQYRFRVRPRAEGAQLRQPLSDGADADHGRFSGRGEGLLGGAQDRRADLSRAPAANVSLEATLANGAMVVGRNAHQPQQAAHPNRSACGRARSRPLPATLTAIAEADVITLRPGLAVHQRDSQPAGGRHSGGDPFLAGR